MAFPNKAWGMVILISFLLLIFLVMNSGPGVKKLPTAEQAVGYVGLCLFDSNLNITTPVGDHDVIVNTTFFFDINISNPSNQSVSFDDNTQLFSVDNETGVINFTPNDLQVGVYYVNITLHDACGNFRDFDFSTFTVKLEDNLPPVLDFIPDQVIYQNDPMREFLKGVSGPVLILTYSEKTPSP